MRFKAGTSIWKKVLIEGVFDAMWGRDGVRYLWEGKRARVMESVAGSVVEKLGEAARLRVPRPY